MSELKLRPLKTRVFRQPVKTGRYKGGNATCCATTNSAAPGRPFAASGDSPVATVGGSKTVVDWDRRRCERAFAVERGGPRGVESGAGSNRGRRTYEYCYSPRSGIEDSRARGGRRV